MDKSSLPNITNLDSKEAYLYQAIKNQQIDELLDRPALELMKL